MKYMNKLWIRIVAALVIGFLLAGVATKITYNCQLIDGAKGCVSFEKAIMHPDDLLSNRQDSFSKFSTTFVISSLIAFTLLSAVSVVNKKK